MALGFEQMRKAAWGVGTGFELAAARRRLDLTLADLAVILRMTSPHAVRHLREMEAGTRELSGAVAAAVGLLVELMRS
jgi:hypothetical protein